MSNRGASAAQRSSSNAFSSPLSVFFAVVGAPVGYGALLRFPRVLANHAEHGGLVFLLCMVLFTFLWACPVIVAEYGIGRFRRKGVIEGFAEAVGVSERTRGAWVCIVNLMITSGFAVLLGDYLYYIVYFAQNDLPVFVDGTGCNASAPVAGNSTQIWKAYEYTASQMIYHVVGIALAALGVVGGARSIELSSFVIMPTMFALLFAMLCYVLTLERASKGVDLIFKVRWDDFADVHTWIDALVESTFQTGAAFGVHIVYAAYMSASTPIVKLAMVVPVIHVMVGVFTSIFVFALAFSTFPEGSCTEKDILDNIGGYGAGSGITFIWIPMLFQRLHAGKVWCLVYYSTLALAGLTSLIAFLEMSVRTLVDLNFRRSFATVLCASVVFLLGIPSILAHNFFAIQDFVWTLGLVISGLLVVNIVWRSNNGKGDFRAEVVNELLDARGFPIPRTNDWTLPKLWEYVILYLVPAESLVIFVWWIVASIKYEPHAYDPTKRGSLMSVAIPWLVVVGILYLARNTLAPVRIATLGDSWYRWMFLPPQTDSQQQQPGFQDPASDEEFARYAPTYYGSMASSARLATSSDLGNSYG